MNTVKTNHKSDVGRFMVSSAAIIQDTRTNKILLLKRSDYSGLETDLWEIPCGRIAQHEDLIIGLKREIKEETGITDIQVGSVLNTWHSYRGEKSSENEVIGITFYCESTESNVKLSPEHSTYQWVTPEEAEILIGNSGTKEDVRKYIEQLRKTA